MRAGDGLKERERGEKRAGLEVKDCDTCNRTKSGETNSKEAIVSHEYMMLLEIRHSQALSVPSNESE